MANHIFTGSGVALVSKLVTLRLKLSAKMSVTNVSKSWIPEAVRLLFRNRPLFFLKMPLLAKLNSLRSVVNSIRLN